MQPDYQVAIIGAGFGGLGMAIALKDRGQHAFVVLEKENDVGGCWRDNTYPGGDEHDGGQRRTVTTAMSLPALHVCLLPLFILNR